MSVPTEQDMEQIWEEFNFRKGRVMSAEAVMKDVPPTYSGQCVQFTPLKGFPQAVEESKTGEMTIEVDGQGYPIKNAANRLKTYRRWENSNTNIFYMNGMKTDGKAHLNAARHIATIANQDVRGILCETMGFGIDLLQSAMDWLRPVGRAAEIELPVLKMGNTFSINGISNSIKDLSKNAKSEHMIMRYADMLLVGNPASQALFKKLWEISKTTQKTVLICHSQGNLITANALWVLRQLRSPEKMGNITVLGLASPNPSWPPSSNGEFNLKLFRDKEDPVTLLSLPSLGRKPSMTPNHMKETGMGAHGVHLYLSHPHFQRALFELIK